MKRFLATMAMTAAAACAFAGADLYTARDLADKGRKLEAQRARFASEDLKRYGNHYTMLAYRDGTGSSEIHQNEADIFVVEKGECEIVIGGKMVGSHETKPGELRGTSIAGGSRFPLKTGDVLHIPAGVAHQMIVTEGKPISYFVVKVSGQ